LIFSVMFGQAGKSSHVEKIFVWGGQVNITEIIRCDLKEAGF